MAAPTLKLNNIQGNTLGGFNKDFQSNLFIKFTSKAAGRAWIKEVSDEIAASSSADVIKFNNQFSALRAQGVKKPEALISAVWVNLALSFAGLSALDLPAGDLKKLPTAFQSGMAARKTQIGDVGTSDPEHWLGPFKTPNEVHAVLMVAADHEHQLQNKVNAITGTAAFKAGIIVTFDQPGRTRPDQPGHEHFGFKDGVSQPGVRGVDPPDDPIANPNQGHPGQDLLWPGEFVLGYPTQIPAALDGVDGPNPTPGPLSPTDPGWTADGSYLVFRRLKQDVSAFNHQIATVAPAMGWSLDLTGAKLVGRYKSGAPIEQRKFQPSPFTPPSEDPGIASPMLANSNTLNNNFEFGRDPNGAICPMSAHIRKAYPRDEFTPAGNPPGKPEDSESSTQTRRMLRRGIPYGASFVAHDPASAKVDRGLLFFCYQNDIEKHFEFVQHSWVDNAKFPPNPPGEPPLLGDPGLDPIISQSPAGDMLLDPAKQPVSINHFVTTTGGEYFFSPSISTLQQIGNGAITN